MSKTPSEWFEEAAADRPDDFGPNDAADAMAWIARVQRDARAELLAKLTELRAALKAWLEEPTPQRAEKLAAVFATTAP